MEESDFVEELRGELGLASRVTAAHALFAVLTPLGAMLPHHHRRPVAEALPAAAVDALHARDYDPTLDREAFLRAVAEAEHVREPFGLEHAEAVLMVLRRHLDPDVWRTMVAELPDDVRALVPPERTSRAPSRAKAPPTGAPATGATPGHRLADGRPGSRHPVSESPPIAGHSQSVARNPDPHGNSKLSETRGTTQEREHETLAEGEPGPERTISSTHRED